MCVAGCPQPLAGPSGAVRMAAMALDMVDAVERFMSSNGHRIQIRVGMHSGEAIGEGHARSGAILDLLLAVDLPSLAVLAERVTCICPDVACRV